MVRARPPAIVIRTQAMRTHPMAGMGIGLAFLMAPAPQGTMVFFVWNASPSVEIGLYGVVQRRPNFEELALVRLPDAIAQFADQRGYLPRSALLIKPVAGTVGDRVCRFGAHVFLRGQLVARAATVSEPLPAWQGCRILKDGEVFLLADHPASFDSRYFGPLHARHVIGTAVPVWGLGVGSSNLPCSDHSFQGFNHPVSQCPNGHVSVIWSCVLGIAEILFAY